MAIHPEPIHAMKRFISSTAIALTLFFATAGVARAGDRGCHQSRGSHGYSYNYPRYYSSGYCQPRNYNYRPSCPPTYYRSYSCEPRYYSGSCNSYSSGFSISVPGFGFYYRR